MVLVVMDTAVVVMVAMSWYQCRDLLSVRGRLLWKMLAIVLRLLR